MTGGVESQRQGIRTERQFGASQSDLDGEWKSEIFGQNFNSVVDGSLGPDGSIYLLEFYSGDLKKIIYSDSTGVHTSPVDIAGRTRLEQNYPKPFAARTSISFSLAVPEHVVLESSTFSDDESLFSPTDGAGQGITPVTLDAGPMPPGAYFFHLKAGSYSETRAMVRAR